MNKEMLKQIINALKLSVDGVVAKTPTGWDDAVWNVMKNTLLSDNIIDLVLAKLGFQTFDGLLSPEQVKNLVGIIVRAVDTAVTFTPSPLDNVAWGLLRKTVLSDAVIEALLNRLRLTGIAAPIA